MRVSIYPKANEIFDISDAGKYLVDGKRFSIVKELDDMIAGTEFIDGKDEYPMFYDCKSVDNFSNIDMELSKEKTVDAIFRLGDIEGKIGVLNFASAKNPGGGFMTGAQAQEESLCYSSLLYDSLTSEEGNKFYSMNAIHKLPDYTDAMIYSPNVPFIRDSKLKNVPFVTVNVLTSPAINRGVLAKRDDTRKGLKEYDLEMKQRMFKILYEFKKKECRTLILGAFGCGVFDNDPFTIARNWYELINLDVFEGCFDKIVFAVFDRPPKLSCYNPFKNGLGRKIKIYS